MLMRGMEGVGTTDDLLAQVAPAAVDTLGLGRRALHAAIRDPRLLGSAVPGLPWVPPLSDGDGWARPGVGIPLLPTSHGASGCRGLGGGALAGAAAVHSSRGWERGSQRRAHHLCHEARGRGRGTPRRGQILGVSGVEPTCADSLDAGQARNRRGEWVPGSRMSEGPVGQLLPAVGLGSGADAYRGLVGLEVPGSI